MTRGNEPAKRYELLRETRKGERRRGQSVGVPSEYVPTGIEVLLGPTTGRTAEARTPTAA